MWGWFVFLMLILVAVAIAVIITVAVERPPNADDTSADLHGYTKVSSTYQPLSDAPTNRLESSRPLRVYRSNTSVEGNLSSIQAYNWAGYIATAKSGTTNVTSVSGTFTVPALTPSDSVSGTVAIWVGIDGYDSTTLQQIGVVCEWNATTQTQVNYAYFSMYPVKPVLIVAIPVDTGDSISAAVFYEGKSEYRLTLKNNTKGIAVKIPTAYTTVLHTEHSSAQWVVEQMHNDTSFSNLSLARLADFGVVSFTKCMATIGPKSTKVQSIDEFDSVPVTLVSTVGATVAHPTALAPDGQSFTVVFASS
jgi:hypothetical protein